MVHDRISLPEYTIKDTERGIDPARGTLEISYHYGYLFSGLPMFSLILFAILTHLLAIICVFMELRLAIRNRR